MASIDLLHQRPGFFLANLTLTQELFHQPTLSGVYWTLCYEVGFYAVVALVLLACRKSRNPMLLLDVLHVVTVASLAGVLFAHRAVPFPFDLWPHFGLGVLLYDVLRHRWRPATAITATAVVAGIAAFVTLHPVRHSYLDRNGYVSFLTALLFTALLFAVHPLDGRLVRSRAIKVLGWVGVFSYSLYLTHVTVIGYVFKACQMTHVLPRFPSLYLAVTLLVTTAFAWCFYRLCEQPFLAKRTRRPALTSAFAPL